MMTTTTSGMPTKTRIPDRSGITVSVPDPGMGSSARAGTAPTTSARAARTGRERDDGRAGDGRGHGAILRAAPTAECGRVVLNRPARTRSRRSSATRGRSSSSTGRARRRR